MSDVAQIITLWQEMTARGADYVLVTVVAVEGSSYRKPGARMLVADDGRRAGTISGGCLEAEVAKKAWWLTSNGPAIEAYTTFFDEGMEKPYGLGCGGRIHLLLERSNTANTAMKELLRSHEERSAGAMITILDGEHAGERYVLGSGSPVAEFQSSRFEHIAQQALRSGKSSQHKIELDAGRSANVFAEYLPPRLGLFIFGAGDDALPLVEIALTQGWMVVVSDGRAQLATRARFPLAEKVLILGKREDVIDQMRPTDAAVVMSHSYEQDAAILRLLLTRELFYIGVLGPSHRTSALLTEVAADAGAMPEAINQIHSPVGLNLGADTPAGIGLSIAAEILAALNSRLSTPRALRPPAGIAESSEAVTTHGESGAKAVH